MLNPNLTALLSALLGGFLSIAASVLANFYMHNASNKDEKQKEIKSVIQTIYRDTQKVMDNCVQLNGGREEGYDVKIAYDQLGANLDEIEMLVYLYMPNLEKHFLEYREAIGASICITMTIKDIGISPTYNTEGFLDIDEQEKATDKFRKELRNILQKRVTRPIIAMSPWRTILTRSNNHDPGHYSHQTHRHPAEVNTSHETDLTAQSSAKHND